MKKNNNFLFLLTLLLVGCGSTSSITPPTTGGPTSTVTPSIGFVDEVPTGFIENLTGTYYAKEGKITVNNEQVTFNDISFTSTKRVVESFKENGKNVDHAVTYLKDGQDEYRIYLSGNGRYVLNLDKKEEGEYVLVDSFMPSISEFTGAYSAYGDANEYNTIVHLGDNFNKYYGSFDVGYYGLFAGYHLDSFYAKSSYIYFNNELTTLVSMYDYVDNYEYYSFIIKETENFVGLINPSYYTGGADDYYDYYYDPLCLSYNYFSNEGSISYPLLDAQNKKVTINEVEYAYEMKFDATKGQRIDLTSQGKNVSVYPNQYGMDWVENDKTTQYVYDSDALIFGTYSYEGIEFEYGYDDEFEISAFVNGEKVSHTYTIFNNTKAVKVNYDNKDYYFAPFKQDIALICKAGEEEVFFVNENEYVSIYGRTFINKVADTYKEIIITDEFLVVYDGKITEANLYYDPLVAYPYLQFEANEKEYMFTLLQENIGAASLTTDGEEVSYFFDKELIAQYYGDYTFHHEIDLSLSEFKLNYYGERVDYTIEPYYNEDSFTYLLAIRFNADNQEITSFLAAEMMVMDVKEGNKVVTKICIKHTYFSELVGEYYFEGEFGPEKIKLTEDGHFYADTVNGTNDGLIYDVEYDYSLQMTMDSTGTKYPSLIFKLNQTLGIQFVKVGHTMVVGNTPYTAKYFFDFRGVYVDQTNSNVVEIREDSIFVNGEEKDITNLSYDEYGTYITAEVNGTEVTYTFTKYDEEYYVSSDENFYTEYTKSSFDFDTLIGEYVFETTTYTLKEGVIPLTTTKYGYALSDGFMTINEYGVVLRNGNLALMFKLSGNTIYIYNDGSANVIDVVKPSLPPVPPPPPPPPLV